MLSLFRTLITGLLLLISCTSVFAATAEATVELPIIEKEQIEPLLTQGLIKVLARLTGNPNIEENKTVQDIINKPNDYLENYAQQSQPERLIISYNQVAIEQSLNEAGISYWGKHRPTIIAWWLNETPRLTELVDDTQPISKIIIDASNNQGFPLLFPLADLNDQALANNESFNTKVPDEILKSSEKYMANATLIVTMQQKDKTYLAQWRLWLADNNTKPLAQGNIEDVSVEDITQQLFITINSSLAKVFLIKTTSTETLNIIVKNLNFSRYAQVNNLIESFGGKALETTGSTVYYQVKADPAQIKAQFNLLHFREEKEEKQTNHDNLPTLIFQPSST